MVRRRGGADRDLQRDLLRRHAHEDEGELLSRLPRRVEHGGLHLLRGAAEQTVAQSKSKHYGYAVGYIQRLESLAGLISEWGDLPRHGDWWDAFMKRHHRKSALVAKLKKAQIELPDRIT